MASCKGDKFDTNDSIEARRGCDERLALALLSSLEVLEGGGLLDLVGTGTVVGLFLLGGTLLVRVADAAVVS